MPVGGCSNGQLIGAVLGTFFSSVALCGVIALVAYICCRCHRHHDDDNGDAEKSKVKAGAKVNGAAGGDAAAAAPARPGNAYTNLGFRDQTGPAYESHATLPIRQQSDVTDTVSYAYVDRNDVDAVKGTRLQGQESLVKLTLGSHDVIGKSFSLKGRSDCSSVDGTGGGGVGGGICVAEVFSAASDLLRSLMNSGDEVLDVGVTIKQSTTVESVVSLLQSAAATHCPVRLTLLRRRHTYVNSGAAAGASGAAGGRDRVGPSPADSDDKTTAGTGKEDSPFGFSSFSSDATPPGGRDALTRWRSTELELQERPTSAEEQPHAGKSQESINYSQQEPAQHGHHQLVRARSTQIFDEAEDTAAAGMVDGAGEQQQLVSNPSMHPSASVDELYANSSSWTRRPDADQPRRPASTSVRQNDVIVRPAPLGDNNESPDEIARKSGDERTPTSGAGGTDEYDSFSDSLFSPVHDYVNVADTLAARTAAAAAPAASHPISPAVLVVDGTTTAESSSDDVTADGEDYENVNDYVNHDNIHLQQQQRGAGKRAAPRDPRDALREPDLEGLEKALKAKERTSRGGLAYYVDLEEHFPAFPGAQQPHGIAGSSTAGSLDDLTADT